jgi:hypothetical protein
MHFLRRMPIDSARAFFEAVAARGQEPRLADAVGTWEFDVDGVGTWSIAVDHGALRVAEGATAKGGTSPATRLRLREDELLRLANGEGHENVFTAVLRGAASVEGDLAFGNRMRVILPMPDDWRVGA